MTNKKDLVLQQQPLIELEWQGTGQKKHGLSVHMLLFLAEEPHSDVGWTLSPHPY